MPPNTPPKSGHGGARPGAGRKPKPKLQSHTELLPYANPVTGAEQRCTDRLTRTLQTLERMADGDEGDSSEEWAAAGTVTIGKGREERLAFPHLPPEQLVLINRKTTRTKPDVRAGIYLADRALGRPGTGDTVKIEEIVSAELQVFIKKIWQCFDPDVAQAIFRAVAAPDPTAADLPHLTLGHDPTGELAVEPAAPPAPTPDAPL